MIKLQSNSYYLDNLLLLGVCVWWGLSHFPLGNPTPTLEYLNMDQVIQTTILVHNYLPCNSTLRIIQGGPYIPLGGEHKHNRLY